jgi:enamine deaminase RidA (YjgF/YER057c/UK114 family)
VSALTVRAALAALALLPAAAAAQAASPPAAPRFVSPPSLPPSRGYSQVVDVPAGSRMLYVAGQVALDSTGRLVGAGDLRAQTRQVFENLRRALAAGGATFADVVKLSYFVLDASQLGVVREVRDAYVNVAAPPASTLVEVRRLFRDDVLIEIEAIAVVPRR